MDTTNLYLTPRTESVRDSRPVHNPLHFDLEQIKNHFDESFISICNQFDVAEELNNQDKTAECQNIWRSQVVFFEGILDFYLHEISKYALYQMFRGDWEKSERYNSLKISMKEVENALEFSESKEWFFAYISQEYSKTVFLSAESMKDQLNLIGLPFKDVMHKAFHKETINESQKFGAEVVKQLFERRNKIAHQIDRSHESADQNSISREYVEIYMNQIKDIVNAIHELASEK